MNIKNLFNLFKRKSNKVDTEYKIEESNKSYVYVINGSINKIDFHIDVDKFEIISENDDVFEIKTEHYGTTIYDKSHFNQLKVVNKKNNKNEIECNCITKDFNKIDEYTKQIEENLLFLSKTKKSNYIRYNYTFREYKDGYYTIFKPELICLKNTTKSNYNYFSIIKRFPSEKWTLNSGYTDSLDEFEKTEQFENVIMLNSIATLSYPKNVKVIIIGILSDNKRIDIRGDDYLFNLRYILSYDIKDSEIVKDMAYKYFQLVVNNPEMNFNYE